MRDHHDSAAYRDQKKCEGWEGKPECAETFPKSKRRRCLECQAQHERTKKLAFDKRRTLKKPGRGKHRAALIAQANAG